MRRETVSIDNDAMWRHHPWAMNEPRRLNRQRFGDRFSEGARLLWLAIAGDTQAAASIQLGCAKGMLTNWLYGDRSPSAPWLTKIQDEYGVPADAWGRPPVQTFTLPAVAQAADDQGDSGNGRATGTDSAVPHSRST
jgi:hypothetical protein